MIQMIHTKIQTVKTNDLDNHKSILPNHTIITANSASSTSSATDTTVTNYKRKRERYTTSSLNLPLVQLQLF
jgi:hypothetical protein